MKQLLWGYCTAAPGTRRCRSRATLNVAAFIPLFGQLVQDTVRSEAERCRRDTDSVLTLEGVVVEQQQVVQLQVVRGGRLGGRGRRAAGGGGAGGAGAHDGAGRRAAAALRLVHAHRDQAERLCRTTHTHTYSAVQERSFKGQPWFQNCPFLTNGKLRV